MAFPQGLLNLDFLRSGAYNSQTMALSPLTNSSSELKKRERQISESEKLHEFENITASAGSLMCTIT